MSFLKRVLEAPSYGFERGGALYVPSTGELLREFLSHLNVFHTRKNWLAWYGWTTSSLLASPLVVFAIYHFTWPLLLVGFLMVIGCILHIYSALVLVVPLILPVAAQYGVDPVHLGIIFVATMELGYLLPPIGLNLYISSYRFEQPVLRVCAATFPFVLILLVAVLLITFVSPLSLALTGR